MKDFKFTQTELNDGRLAISLLDHDMELGKYFTGMCTDNEVVLLKSELNIIGYTVADDDNPILTKQQRSKLLVDYLTNHSSVSLAIGGVAKCELKGAMYQISIGDTVVSRVYMCDLPLDILPVITNKEGHRYFMEVGDVFLSDYAGGDVRTCGLSESQLTNLFYYSISLIKAVPN